VLVIDTIILLLSDKSLSYLSALLKISQIFPFF
jgi:hypothetical protein